MKIGIFLDFTSISLFSINFEFDLFFCDYKIILLCLWLELLFLTSKLVLK